VCRISVLHGQEDKAEIRQPATQEPSQSTILLADTPEAENIGIKDGSGWKQKTEILFYSFLVSGIYVSRSKGNKEMGLILLDPNFVLFPRHAASPHLWFRRSKPVALDT
jgi:hypothetical protein